MPRFIEPSATIVAETPDMVSVIEKAARICYQSEAREGESPEDFLRRTVMAKGHESCLEHGVVTVDFSVDRGVTHELVRHRISSFSQESTRYCNYGKEKFGSEIAVIEPSLFPKDEPKQEIPGPPGFRLDSVTVNKYDLWYLMMRLDEWAYLSLVKMGATPQGARSVLPNSTKAQILHTANIREWRHIFRLRTSAAAHPQMREVMEPLLAEFRKRWPVFFEDLR